jgi:4-cresol dehydrogenase (hydroxylating) flavoprotein subunit
LAEEQGLTLWTFVGGIYGTRQQVKAHKSEISKYLSPLGRLIYVDDTSQKWLNMVVLGVRKPGVQGVFYRALKSFSHLFVTKLSSETMESLLSLYPILKGKPNEGILAAAYFKNKERQPAENLDPARDGCGLLWFAPILPAIGLEIQAFVEQIKQICAVNKFETAVLLIQVNPRTFLVLVPLFYRRENDEEAERAQKTSDELCGLLRRHNYQQYRCSTPYMETILDGNPSYRHLMEQIKQALDPNQVIAPGRYGV